MKRRNKEALDEKDVREISTASFYGSPTSEDQDLVKRKRWETHLKKLEKLESEFQSNPLTQLYKPRLSDACILRKTFFKQQEAFDFVQQTCDSLHVFSFESPSASGANTGRRQYLVCSYPHFYHYYKQLRNKHHYEVIPEGAPCRLNFDLEFFTENNQDRDGDRMVDTLIKIVNHVLMRLYGVQCSRDHVVDLEASTKVKFSRHLIYHVPGAVFRDNVQAGNFVNHVCSQILSFTETADTTGTAQGQGQGQGPLRGEGSRAGGCEEALGVSEEEARQLLVKTRDGGQALFCDLGVYTKNRNFRLLLSTKLGKSAPLLVSRHSTFPGHPASEQFFLQTLVSNVSMSPETRVLTCDFPRLPYMAPPGARKTPLDGAGLSPYPDIDHFIRDVIKHGGPRDQSLNSARKEPDITKRATLTKTQQDEKQGADGQIKFQHGDRIQDGGVPVGGIRRWSYFEDCELLLYDIHTYRYCENIGRHHRSNNIMLLVDLRKGVYYQKCHDPDCHRQNYKSQDYPVPDHLLPKHYFDYLTSDSDFSDTDFPDRDFRDRDIPDPDFRDRDFPDRDIPDPGSSFSEQRPSETTDDISSYNNENS